MENKVITKLKKRKNTQSKEKKEKPKATGNYGMLTVVWKPYEIIEM